MEATSLCVCLKTAVIKRPEMFIDVLTSYVEHYNSQNQTGYSIFLAIEETRNKGIYDARG